MWKCQTSGNGDVAVLSAVLFLRACTPARLCAAMARGALGCGSPATGTVARCSRARKGAEKQDSNLEPCLH